MRIYNFTTKSWEDEDEQRKKQQANYFVSKNTDGTMRIGGGGKNAVPFGVWNSDPAYKEAREAIRSNKIADFNSSQARESAKARLPQPMPLQQALQTWTAPKVTMAGLKNTMEAAGKPKTQPAQQKQPSIMDVTESVGLIERKKWDAVKRNAAEKKADEKKEIDQLARTKGIDWFLNAGKLSDVQRKAAKKVLAQAEQQYKPQLREFTRQAFRTGPELQMPEDLAETQAKINALKNKTSALRALGTGASDALSFNLPKKIEANANREALEKLEQAAKIRPLSETEQKDLAYLRSVGGKAESDVIAESNPLPYGVGSFAGEAAKYTALGPFVRGLPVVGKISAGTGNLVTKLGGSQAAAGLTSRLMAGRLADLPFDTANALIGTSGTGSLASPDRWANIGKSLAAQQAMGLAMDTGMEAIGAGYRTLKNFLKNSNAPDATAGGLLPDMAEQAVKESAADASLDAVKEANQKNYMDQINRVMLNDNPPDIIKIGETPEILQQYGASARTLTMKPGSVRKIAYPAGYMGGKHNLGFYALEHLPEQLENPVAILKSSTQDDSLVVFTEFLDAENRPVMAAIHLDKDGRIGITNDVASYYGRNSFNNFIAKERDAGNVIFEDKKRILEQLPGTGLQLPRMEADADPMLRLARENAAVKGNFAGLPTDFSRKPVNIRDLVQDESSAGKAIVGPGGQTVLYTDPEGQWDEIRKYMTPSVEAPLDANGNPIKLELDPNAAALKNRPPYPANEAGKARAEEALNAFEINRRDYRLNEDGVPVHHTGFDPDNPPVEKKVDFSDSETPFDNYEEIKNFTLEDEMRGLSEPSGKPNFAEEDPEIVQKRIFGQFSNEGVSYAKDPARNFDAAAGKNVEARQWLRENVEQPWLDAKKEYTKSIKDDLDVLDHDIVQGLGIKKGSKESAAVQWYGEGQRLDKYGHAHDFTLAQLQEEFPDSWRKIVAADAKFREFYNEFYRRENEVLDKIYPAAEFEVTQRMKRLDDEAAGAGMRLAKLEEELAGAPPDIDVMLRQELEAEIDNTRDRIKGLNLQSQALLSDIESGDALRNRRLPYRMNYYHHFREMESEFEGIRNVLSTSHEIDPRLVGVSDNTKPNAIWKGFMQRREGAVYKADAVGGMLKYIPAVEYKINIDPVTANNRKIIEQLRIDTVESRNANKFIDWMEDWTNGLAGKTNYIDRPIQKNVDRRFMAAVNWVNGRVKSNAVLGNLNSAVNQIYNLPNAAGYIKNPADMVSGLKKWGRAVGESIQGDAGGEINNLMKQSGFLEERYLDKAFSRFDEGILTAPRKFAKWLLNVGDEQSTRWIWLSAYDQAQRQGIKDAVSYADDIARRSVGGRGVGEVPVMLQSKIVNLVAPFQLEVNNAFQSLKEHIGKKDALAVAEIIAAGWALNNLGEMITGNRTAFDPLNAIQEAFSEEIPEKDDKGKEINPYLARGIKVAGRLGGEIISAHPAGNFIASAVAPDNNIRKTLFGERDPSRFGTGNIGINAFMSPVLDTAYNAAKYAQGSNNRRNPDWQQTVLNLALPFGGKQVDRSIKAAQDVGLIPRLPWNKAGEIAPEMTANYSAGGQFRFPISTDTPNAAKTIAFGPFASREGKKYLAEGRKPLSDEGTKQIQEAFNAGVAPEAFLNIRDILKSYKPIKDAGGKTLETAVSQERQALLDDTRFTPEQKKLLDMWLINNGEETKREYSSRDAFIVSGFSDSDKEKWNALQAAGFSLNQFLTISGKYKEINEKFDDSGKGKEKKKATAFYQWLDTQGLSNAQYDAVTQNMKYWQNTPAEPEKYRWDLLNPTWQAAHNFLQQNYNLSDDKFMEYYNAVKNVKGDDENSVNHNRISALTGIGLSEAEAQEFIRAAYQTAYTLDDLEDSTLKHYRNLNSQYGISEDMFLTGYNTVRNIQGVKGANGKTISNSQKKARYKALRDNGWTHDQAVVFLMEIYSNYRNNNWW